MCVSGVVRPSSPKHIGGPVGEAGQPQVEPGAERGAHVVECRCLVAEEERRIALRAGPNRAREDQGPAVVEALQRLVGGPAVVEPVQVVVFGARHRPRAAGGLWQVLAVVILEEGDPLAEQRRQLVRPPLHRPGVGEIEHPATPKPPPGTRVAEEIPSRRHSSYSGRARSSARSSPGGKLRSRQFSTRFVIEGCHDSRRGSGSSRGGRPSLPSSAISRSRIGEERAAPTEIVKRLFPVVVKDDHVQRDSHAAGAGAPARRRGPGAPEDTRCPTARMPSAAGAAAAR